MTDARNTLRIVVVFALSLATSACVRVAVSSDDTARTLAATLRGARYVDLTYSFADDTIYWPTAQGFHLERVAAGPSQAGYWYEANNICTAEHGGTHMDAPVHFAEGQLTADRVPVTAGIGALVRIDVRAQANSQPDYRLSVADIAAWEERYGRLPPDSVVVMYSGWGSRWPDAQRYLGNDRGDTNDLHFPGFSSEAVRFLSTEREVGAIGVDTPSIDHGPSREFIAHRIWHGAGKPAFENLANLDRVPPSGAIVIALPMKIQGGSGGPLRAVAVIPPGLVE